MKERRKLSFIPLPIKHHALWKIIVEMDLQKKRQRIEDFLCLIDAFPNTSEAGRQEDEHFKQLLQNELENLTAQLNTLTTLNRNNNELRRLNHVSNS